MNNLEKKIKSKNAIICVIGLGYVGYPLLKLIYNNGFKLIGLDNDKNKIRKLKAKPLKKVIFTKPDSWFLNQIIEKCNDYYPASWICLN